MSHFTVLRTQLTETDALVKALNDVGYKHVEIHELAQHLYGFMGDRRRQTAEVIVRRKHIGRASNDLGFKRGEDGRFAAIISSFDRGKHNQVWLGRLTQRYAYHVARRELQLQGFDLISEETRRDGQVHLVLRRVSA